MPKLRTRRRRLALRTPVRTSWGEMREREVLEVRLTWDDGDFGLGEAAPLEHRDGVATAAVAAALEAYGEVLRRLPADASHAEMLAACAAERPLPQALAAIDLALWDRAGRRARRPVARLLAPDAVRAVPVTADLWSRDPVFTAAEAYRAVMAGHSCVRVRVGMGDDVARVNAVRGAVGPRVAIRIDAAGAWRDRAEALAALEALAEAGIEFVEDPLGDRDEIPDLERESPIAVAVDAGAAAARDSPAPEFVRLTVSGCGGISGLLAAARASAQAGARPYITSNLDGPLGLAAGVQAAAALLAERPLAPCGLATLGMFAEHAHMLPVENGRIDAPSEPGLLGTTTQVK
jgi:L-alanine-DL-glutamate epimerase-like enolase superfamily enzyme